MMAARAAVPGHALTRLLAGHAALGPGDERAVTGIATDSRSVVPGDLFFARRGQRVDAAALIPAAIAAGAVAAVREGAPATARAAGGAPVVAVPDLAACLGEAAHRFHGAPSKAVRVIGVTGTNGKTSVSHFVARALGEEPPDGTRRVPVGLLGTLGYGLLDALEPAGLTTPECAVVHRVLGEMRDAGAREVVMEASSHALDQGRLAAVRFAVAVFTNLSRDHLDYHGSMEAYRAAKRRLFATPGLSAAVANLDDPAGAELLDAAPAGARRIACTLSGARPRTGVEVLSGRVLRLDRQGIEMAVASPRGEARVAAALSGRFNAHNLLLALGALLALGMPLDVAAGRLGNARPVPGRMERFGGDGSRPLVVVDYAHTPAALAGALEALRAECAGRLWCVFGCGGDRDRGKRPEMGEVAASLADRVVITDDNPRGEDGDLIVSGILDGIAPARRGAVTVERRRERAIAAAVSDADPPDVVLVAGKGHEAYQESDGVRRAFSDAAAVRAALRARNA